MFGRDQREMILESLLVHIDFLEAAAQRHKNWINDIPDREMEDAHVEIIGLLRQTRQKYVALVDKYNGHHE